MPVTEAVAARQVTLPLYPTMGEYGVEVVVETDYASTLRFLEQIEGLPWAVQVSSLDYEVVGYPRAELALTAHTFLLETEGTADGE